MRTTLNLQDAAFQAASEYAAARAMKLGDAVSELVQRGIGQTKEPRIAVKKVHGIWIFEVPPDATRPAVTSALVKELMEDDS